MENIKGLSLDEAIVCQLKFNIKKWKKDGFSVDIYNDFITSLLKWQVEVFPAWYESNLSEDIKKSKMYVS